MTHRVGRYSAADCAPLAVAPAADPVSMGAAAVLDAHSGVLSMVVEHSGLLRAHAGARSRRGEQDSSQVPHINSSRHGNTRFSEIDYPAYIYVIVIIGQDGLLRVMAPHIANSRVSAVDGL